MGVDFIGGFSALVHKGTGDGDRRLIASIPEALAATERVCASVNVATTRAGINMDAVLDMAHTIRRTAELTAERDCIGCAKLVVFANMVEDNPFMAGAVHGTGEPDEVINVGISGPGVVRAIVDALPQDADLTAIAEAIKATSFKITRVGELVAREAARRLGVTMGIVDLSLAPTPAEGDSVAEIIEAMGVERCGGPGTTAALALLNDAVKKGGAMGTSSIGGLSGAFIPVSEDQGMILAAESGALSIEKLEAMTSVCSVGLDMIAIPGDTDRRDDRRHHRRRVRHRRRQRQDHRRAPHPRHRQGRRRAPELRRPARRGAGHGGQPVGRHRLRAPRRPLPGTAAVAEELEGSALARDGRLERAGSARASNASSAAGEGVPNASRFAASRAPGKDCRAAGMCAEPRALDPDRLSELLDLPASHRDVRLVAI